MEPGFEHWLRDTNRSEKTIQAYRLDVGGFIKWFEQENGETFSSGLLNGPDLRAFARMSKGSMRAASWNRKRSALRVFCTWALEAGYVTYDPFADIPSAEPDELPTRWLTAQEFNRLRREMEIMVNQPAAAVKRADAVRNRAMLALGLYAGLREAEIVALRLDEIILGDRSGRIIVRNGKGGKHREPSAGKELRLALRLWLDVRGEEPGRLFNLSTRQVQRIVAEVGHQAKIEDLTPHALRHTFAKMLIRNGKDLAIVSALLGHSRIETTKRYVQPGREDFDEAVEEL
jgi:integrase/recombinase XerC